MAGQHDHCFKYLPRDIKVDPKTNKKFREYDPKDPNHHWYDVEGIVCFIGKDCTLDSVALVSRMHPAPGTLSNKIPVKDGQLSVARMGYNTEFDTFGPVRHIVQGNGCYIRNEALPGHKLYPGYVERIIVKRGNAIFIRTIGEGTGAMKEKNEQFADLMWNIIVNGHIRYELNLQYRKKR